jgi:hypothetical protein
VSRRADYNAWMDPNPSSRRASHLIGAVAILALLVGVGVLASQWRPRSTTTPIPAANDTSEAVIGQALGQIPVDSAAIKSEWRDEVRGIDVAKLDEREQEIFVRFANAERCTCGCGYTLAACRTYDLTCPVSGSILEKLRDSVAAGLVRSAAGLRERPRPG